MSTMQSGNLFDCLTDKRKKLFPCLLQFERGLKNVLELPLLKVLEKGVRYLCRFHYIHVRSDGTWLIEREFCH